MSEPSIKNVLWHVGNLAGVLRDTRRLFCGALVVLSCLACGAVAVASTFFDVLNVRFYS